MKAESIGGDVAQNERLPARETRKRNNRRDSLRLKKGPESVPRRTRQDRSDEAFDRLLAESVFAFSRMHREFVSLAIRLGAPRATAEALWKAGPRMVGRAQ